MKKVRIAVWGINDALLDVIKKEIDPRKSEIVLFIDNDKAKYGDCYLKHPVLEPKETLFEEYVVDYVLVTALSAFEAIREQIMTMGLHKEKIQIFFTERLCDFCLGALDDVDMNLIDTIYFEPGKIKKFILKYQEIYRKYIKVPAFEEDEKAWFNKSSLVSHACGGVINGRKLMYSNSKEAFSYSMEQNFKLLECDMMRLNHQEMILAHDYERFYEAEQEHYSMMTARELLERLKEYSDVSCLIDVKWKDYEDYDAYLSDIEQMIEEITENEQERQRLKDQIVMEVYDEPTIKLACARAFHMILTSYRNPDRRCLMNTINLCHQYGVKAIALGLGMSGAIQKTLKIVVEKNIKIFVFSTDSIEDYQRLRKMGVTGILTNYLTENDIQ